MVTENLPNKIHIIGSVSWKWKDDISKNISS